MELHELTVLGPSFSSYVLEKHWRYFGIKEELFELIGQLCQLDEFNVLHLNSAEFDADDTKIVFAMEEFNALL